MRSGFRIAEFKDGYNGYLYTHEGWFYGFDAVSPFYMSQVILRKAR